MTIPLGQMFPFASSDQPEPQIWKSIQRDSYLVLLPVGFAVPVCYQTSGALLPHRFILTDPEGSAVYFLLHFPSGHPARGLPGTVFP